MSREENRKKFPLVAAFVDQMRAAGIAVTVAYASENGNEAGDIDRFNEWDRAAVLKREDSAELAKVQDRMYRRDRPKANARRNAA